MDHLTSLDASFLHFEAAETPMHVGSLMLFELPPGYSGDYFEDVKAVIGKRMHLVRVFHRKLATMPFDLADPLWVDDDDIDLDFHVRHVMLRKPGSMAQLEQLVARLHSSLLDRSRPLWEICVIEGLSDGRVGLYVKAHHSGIDGKAGVELSKIIYDLSPQVREVPPPRRRSAGAAQRPLGMAELLRAGLSNSLLQYGKMARLVPTGVKAVLTTAKIVAKRRKPEAGRGLNLGLGPKTLMNVTITNQRSFATLSMPLADIKALGARVGGTVNTIVMAMCAGGLRRFLTERGPLPQKPLIAAVPVSLRAADDASANNQVTMVRVDLATDIADPAARFKAIHNSSEGAKSVVRELKPVLGVDLPVFGSPWLMSGLAAVAVRSGLFNAMPQVANAVISNVPGIPVPLYLAGARATNFYPVSIPYHGMAINITVQSYAGQLEFGLTACRRVFTHDELHELLGYMRDTLAEIRSFEALPGFEDKAEASKFDTAKADAARADTAKVPTVRAAASTTTPRPSAQVHPLPRRTAARRKA